MARSTTWTRVLNRSNGTETPLLRDSQGSFVHEVEAHEYPPGTVAVLKSGGRVTRWTAVHERAGNTWRAAGHEDCDSFVAADLPDPTEIQMTVPKPARAPAAATESAPGAQPTIEPED